VKVTREEAAANRERIIEAASRLFREKGFNGIGVADLMKEAGLTHGGFYGHFKSKDDLAAQACGAALAKGADLWTSLVGRSGEDPLGAAARSYLSERHLSSPGSGCVFATLAPEAARGGPKLRRVFAEGMSRWAGILADALPGRTKAEKRRKSLAAVSQMVGAMVLARAVDDPALAREILQVAIADLTDRPG
jgi:TetR/AcrR family transcriptional regulator, transcriptional repressor for nem operon